MDVVIDSVGGALTGQALATIVSLLTSGRVKPIVERNQELDARAGIPLGSRPVDLVATAGAASENHHVHPGTIQNRYPG